MASTDVLYLDSAAKSLRTLDAWATAWGMAFNASKCGIVPVPRLGADIDHSFKEAQAKEHMFILGGETVRVVRSYVYLGILFDMKLDLEEMVKARAGHGVKTLLKLQPVICNTSLP